MKVYNIGDQSAMSHEEEFRIIADEYLTLILEGRVHPSHPIHEKVRIAYERLISDLKG